MKWEKKLKKLGKRNNINRSTLVPYIDIFGTCLSLQKLRAYRGQHFPSKPFETFFSVINREARSHKRNDLP